MRLERVYIPIIAVSCIVNVEAIRESCPEGTVNQAVSNNFIDFVLSRCIQSTTTSAGAVRFNTAPMSPSDCFSSFNTGATNPGDFLIPSGSDCEQSFIDFIADMQARAADVDIFPTAGTLNNGGDGCVFTGSAVVKMSYNCWYRLFAKPTISPLVTFQVNNDGQYSLATCDINYIKKLGDRNIFSDSMKNLLTNGAPGTHTVCDEVSSDCVAPAGANYIVPPDFSKSGTVPQHYKATLGVREAVCLGCMAELLNRVQADYATGTPTIDVVNCRTDPLGFMCLNNGPMMNWITAYTQCTGGYSIKYNSGQYALLKVSNLASKIDTLNMAANAAIEAQSAASGFIQSAKASCDDSKSNSDSAAQFVAMAALSSATAVSKSNEAISLLNTPN